MKDKTELDAIIVEMERSGLMTIEDAFVEDELGNVLDPLVVDSLVIHLLVNRFSLVVDSAGSGFGW